MVKHSETIQELEHQANLAILAILVTIQEPRVIPATAVRVIPASAVIREWEHRATRANLDSRENQDSLVRVSLAIQETAVSLAIQVLE